MPAFDRRDLFRFGLAASAAGGIPPLVREAPPAAPDVAGRLARLRARKRHIATPSAGLIRAFERIPRPALVYDPGRLLAAVEEGDLLVFEMPGAYSECLFTRFNGVEPPLVHFLDDLIDV